MLKLKYITRVFQFGWRRFGLDIIFQTKLYLFFSYHTNYIL